MHVGVVAEVLDTNPTKNLGRVEMITQYFGESRLELTLTSLGRGNINFFFCQTGILKYKNFPNHFRLPAMAEAP
jgi:hypothetical protein